ncbi:MAG: DNA mismatch repair protein MutS [Methylococcaceae bacterium]|nr:DNA mismatch repair protein MutS [Methylococcaceae bacterium]
MAKKILSAAESALFRQTIGAVKKIKTDKLLLRSGTKPSPYPKQHTPDYTAKLNSADDPDILTVSQEDTLSYLGNGLQKNVLKKLRQGHYGLDGELDLHGLTSAAAKQQLLKFLHDCVEEGCRCVHIVHGKGYRSQDNHPVLKNHLNLWLRQYHDVQAFCSAAQKDGGAGAVMVLLHIAEKYHEED